MASWSQGRFGKPRFGPSDAFVVELAFNRSFRVPWSFRKLNANDCKPLRFMQAGRTFTLMSDIGECCVIQLAALAGACRGTLAPLASLMFSVTPVLASPLIHRFHFHESNAAVLCSRARAGLDIAPLDCSLVAEIKQNETE